MLWNDKRTSSGVYTDPSTGEHRSFEGKPLQRESRPHLTPRQRLDEVMPNKPRRKK